MEKSDIFKVRKDIRRAKDLFEMAKERSSKIIKSLPKDIHYKILEEYYEISVQLLTSFMYLKGQKTLSHVSLIKFASKNAGLTNKEIRILDQMRKFRHGTVYYGRKESGNFFINYEKEIKNIVKKLFRIIGNEIRSKNAG